MTLARRAIPTLVTGSILLAGILMVALYMKFRSSASIVGLPPLHAAIWREDEAGVRAILSYDRSMVNAPANHTWGNSLDGATPLMLAAARGNDILVRLLLDHGAEPLQTDSTGRTAYDYGRMYGHDISSLKPRN